MITSNVAFFPCVSITDTERFYGETLGLELVFSKEKVKIFSANKGHFGFVEYPDKKAATGKLCLSFNMASNEDVDKEFHRLKGLGLDIKEPPSIHPSQPVYSFFITDPSGYLVEFQKIIDLQI